MPWTDTRPKGGFLLRIQLSANAPGESCRIAPVSLSTYAFRRGHTIPNLSRPSLAKCEPKRPNRFLMSAWAGRLRRHGSVGGHDQSSRSRLVEPAHWPRPSPRLAALKRRISSSRASFFSRSRVSLDSGVSVPRNFSRALPTESLVVSAMVQILHVARQKIAMELTPCQMSHQPTIAEQQSRPSSPAKMVERETSERRSN